MHGMENPILLRLGIVESQGSGGLNLKFGYADIWPIFSRTSYVFKIWVFGNFRKFDVRFFGDGPKFGRFWFDQCKFNILGFVQGVHKYSNLRLYNHRGKVIDS